MTAIELTRDMEVDEAKRSLLWVAAWQLIKLGLVIAGVVYGSHYIVMWWGQARNWSEGQYARAIQAVTRVEVVREYIKPEAVPVDQLIPNVARDIKVPRVALQAIVQQESNGTQLYRFEPKVYERLKAKVKGSDSEIRMLSSSHGVAHVMGFNAEERCGVHWSRLYDTITGLECGAKILRENLDRHKGMKEPSDRLWYALRDYNGSGEDAENYANAVMAKVGKLLYAGLKEEL